MAEFRLLLLPGCALVTATGEIDVATAPAFREAIWEGLAQSSRMVVDLRDVGFFDSTGLHVLVTALKKVQELDGQLILVQPSGVVAPVLQATGLAPSFTVRWDLAQAVTEAAQ